MRHELVPLGEVASFIRGVTFKPDDVVSLEGKRIVACMRTKNVQEELDLSDIWAVSEDLVKRDDQYLIDGDVLVSSANSWNLVGKCCAVPRLPWRATFGGFVSVLRPEQRKLDPRYLFRWFGSDRIQKIVKSLGQQTTNIANLNLDRCLRLMVPLPPISEQRRIAEIVDKADALRAKRRAALAQLDTLTQSIFLEMFGEPARRSWPRVQLGSLCDKVIDCAHATPQYASRDTGFFCVRSSDIQNGELTLDQAKQLEESEFRKRVVRGVPEVGDVIYCREGARFGNTARITQPVSVCLGQRMMLFRPKKSDAVTEYLWAFLRSADAYRQATGNVGGSASPHVNIRNIVAFDVVKPPLHVQARFARAVQQIDGVRSSAAAALNHLDALFASLQHRAFRGEL